MGIREQAAIPRVIAIHHDNQPKFAAMEKEPGDVGGHGVLSDAHTLGSDDPDDFPSRGSTQPETVPFLLGQ
jgi:hypothetical protein